MNKLHSKDFTIAFKTGSDANKSKFKKEAIQGEMYFATDTSKLYVAETTAGLSDATLSRFDGESFRNEYALQFQATSSQYLESSNTSQSYTVGTISLWFKPSANITTSSSSQSLLSFGGGFNGLILGNCDVISDELITFKTSSGNYHYTTTLPESMGGRITNDWHHLGVTWDSTSSEYKIYLDGTNKMNTKSGTNAQITIDDVIIAKNEGGFGYFDGVIDEVAIFSQSMSATEIANLRVSNQPTALNLISPQPLSWWRMLDTEGGTGSSVADDGSLSNSMNLMNSPSPYTLSSSDAIYIP